ncbi:MAG: hypothetical protein NTV05_16730 [Acidobacteria bacterium]|nr:hypothetical protein [Acidobacteriota bacterium]
MADSTSPSAQPSNRGVMIVLSYLWILALVPLLTEKEDQEVRWHAKHGIVLMVAEFAFWIVFSIFMNLFAMATLGLGCLVALIGPLIGLAILGLHIFAIVQGLNGKRLIIPVVSDFANKF